MATQTVNAQTAATARAIRENIEAIARLEEESDRRRTGWERVVDSIGKFFGTIRFVAIQAIIFAAWIAWNAVPELPHFDKFPYLLLGLILSIEAIFLSTFVLMRQERMSRRADERAHLDLQINLLAEREMTLVLQMLLRISTRLGVRPAGSAVEELLEETSVEALASELKDKLPAE